MQERLGLMGVMWTVIGLDWKLAAPRIAERVLSRARDGSIVCLHDGRGTLKDPDARADDRSCPAHCPVAAREGISF